MTDDDSIVIQRTPKEDATKSPCSAKISPANLLTNITVGFSSYIAEDGRASDKDDCVDTPIAELADKSSTNSENPSESNEKNDSTSKESGESDSSSKESSERKSDAPPATDSDNTDKSDEKSSAEQSSESEAGSEGDSKEGPPSEDKSDSAGESDSADESGSEGELGSEETSGEGSAGEEGGTSDLESEPTTATPKPPNKDPGKMVSRALEYDLQDMYPEITLLFEDKQSAWNCQDPATIRAMWLESRTNILRDWKFRNGRIHSKEKPKLEVKPTMTVTLRKQFHHEKAKEQDWKEMYIPPGNDAPQYHELALPTNKTTELRYNFIRNNPPIPEAYVLHYEKYRRPPFNVYQPEKCLPSNLIYF